MGGMAQTQKTQRFLMDLKRLDELIEALPADDAVRQQYIRFCVAIEQAAQWRVQRDRYKQERDKAIRFWKDTLVDLKKTIKQRNELLGR
jgi:hypothetical protein